MTTSRWADDAFLDRIRDTNDELANRCVAELGEPCSELTRRLFSELECNGSPIPAGTPKPLAEFLQATRWLPPGPSPDLDKVELGQEAFMTTAVPSCLVLLMRSIPQGYAAPALTDVLNISGNLRVRPYHRLMGTLQFLVDVSSPGAFEESGGKGIVITQKVRLLHAGVRMNVAPRWPGEGEYQRKYKQPINLEDVLATMIAFSFLVVDGLRTLGLTMGDDDADPTGPYTEMEEAFYYLWRLFARRFGVHPAGWPQSDEFIPRNLTEAKTFFESYVRRRFVGPERCRGDYRRRSLDANPTGVALADAHVTMLGEVIRYLVPSCLRRLVPWVLEQAIPRHYMRRLLREPGCARVGMKWTRVSAFLGCLLTALPTLWAKLWDEVDTQRHVLWSEKFLQALIDSEYDREVPFFIPDDREDLEELAQPEDERDTDFEPRTAHWLQEVLDESRKRRIEQFRARASQ